MTSDHYQILGVPRTADAKTIRSAFRKRAAKAHPDKGGSHKAMAEINRAWDVLGDPSKRERYDRTGDDTTQQTPEFIAQQILLQLFNNFLDTWNGANVDVIASMRASLRAEIQKSEVAIGQAQGRVTLIKKGAKRIKGPALVAEMAAAKLQQLNQRIAQEQERVAGQKLALEMLDEYLDVDAPKTSEQSARTMGAFFIPTPNGWPR